MQDSISQVYKEIKILKLSNLLYLQNCLFMSQIETNQRFANSFVDLKHCGDNHNYLTKSKAKGLFDIPFVNTQIYGTQSIKYNCIRNQNNFKHNISTYTFTQRHLYTSHKTSKRPFDWERLKIFFGSRGMDLHVFCHSLLFCSVASPCSKFCQFYFSYYLVL